MSLGQRIALTKLQAWTATRPMLASGPLQVPASPDIAPLIYRTPDWKTDVIDQVLGRRNGAFIDIGANIGQTLIDYVEAERRGGYIGFEPNPRCVQIVADIIRTNAIPDARIIPTGLSDTSTVAPFYVRSDRDTDTTATMVREIRPNDAANMVFVPVYPFDHIHDVLGSPALALIKIDVEGGELLVLRGMKRTLETLRPWLLCEVLARDLHADRGDYADRCRTLMSFIRECGYAAHRLIKSEDDRRIVGVTVIDAFPDVVYGPETANKCDYLLVPSDEHPFFRAMT